LLGVRVLLGILILLLRKKRKARQDHKQHREQFDNLHRNILRGFVRLDSRGTAHVTRLTRKSRAKPGEELPHRLKELIQLRLRLAKQLDRPRLTSAGTEMDGIFFANRVTSRM
jgi:hypothetical protein